MVHKYFYIPLALLLNASIVVADRSDQGRNPAPRLNNVVDHRGQLDTDGILSPGEVRNPSIDYDKAQQYGEDRGDYRYSNRENDSAADVSREIKREEQDRSEWLRHHRYYDDDHYDDYNPPPQRHSWWNW